MRLLKFREVKSLAQGHTVFSWPNQTLNLNLSFHIILLPFKGAGRQLTNDLIASGKSIIYRMSHIFTQVKRFTVTHFFL